jgi:putative endonuclease
VTTVADGARWETLARQRLEAEGLTLLASNVRYRFGELDLVMREGGCVVFVEVRYRASQRFGGALASVTRSKQLRVARAASAFLAANGRLGECPCRFDVIAIAGQMPQPSVEWLKNAFSLDDLGD